LQAKERMQPIPFYRFDDEKTAYDFGAIRSAERKAAER
jgi:hypothetical protein